MKDLKATESIDVRYIHCKNSGENGAFERLFKQEGTGLNFEYTTPGKPQQNGKVNMKFAQCNQV